MSGARAATASLLAMTLAALASPARAEPVLEEIIVTAQKRAESLQDTPISIAAFGSAEIERRGMANVAALSNVVPNLRIVPFGVSPTTLRIFIRGVGVVDSQPTQDPPVGIYLNGVYVARPVGLTLDIANIERVEVLRGPQGTLYGRNTTGGAVNVITKKPDNKFAGSQTVGFGNYGAIRSLTSLNVPVMDKLFVAGAFTFDKRDGWLKNTGAGKDWSEHNRKAGRLDVRFLPVDDLTVDYSFDRSWATYTTDYYHLIQPALAGAFVPGLPAQPNRLKSASLATPMEDSRDKAYGHTLTLTATTPIGELKSITSHRNVRSNSYQDFSGNPFATIYRNNRFTLRQKQTSQELQLVGSTEPKNFDYIAGLYYFTENGREAATDYFFTFPLPRDIAAKNTSYAGYGQLTWRPDAGSPWSVTAGGRFTHDKRRGNNHIVPVSTRTDSNFSASGTIDYKVTEATLLYAKVVQGYKAGGFNMRQTDFARSFGPEKLISYEAGWKSELFDRRLRFNASIFYADYRDIQFDINVPNQPDPTLTQTTNAGKARIFGIESEVVFAVTDTLRLSATYGHLDDKVKKVAGDDARLWRLPNAPAHSLTGTIDWDVLQTNAGVLNLSIDTSFRTASNTAARARPGDEHPAYGVTDARLSFTGENWLGQGTTTTVAFWIRNMFDRAYYLDTFGSFAGVHALKTATFGLPRTYGADVKVAF